MTRAGTSQSRLPQRQRGVRRYEQLLDATEALLVARPETDLSLSMIAEAAGVPLPSVYHFFPNRNAIFMALAERFHRHLATLAAQPLQPRPESWQDVIRRRQTAGARYLNAHPAALRLFMGASVSVEVRNLDLRGNASLALTRAEEFRRLFDCSSLTALEHWLAVTIGLMDGIWAISWTETRSITDAYLGRKHRGLDRLPSLSPARGATAEVSQIIYHYPAPIAQR